MGGVIVANLYGIREADWIIMILPLRTSHCVNYTLIDRWKNCPLHGCNFRPWKFDVSCSIFSQFALHFHQYLSSEVTTIHIFFYIMWMIKIMPQRVKLIKSRFKRGNLSEKFSEWGYCWHSQYGGEAALHLCAVGAVYLERPTCAPVSPDLVVRKSTQWNTEIVTMPIW